MTTGALILASIGDAVRLEMGRRAERAEELPSFREFLESPDYAGPYMAIVGLSPLVAAIVDASEGSPVESLTDEEARAAFRLGLDELPLGEPPRIVVVNAGRQSGKTSNLLAPKCVHAAWTTPAPFLRPGQVARCVIISPKADQARQAFNYCKGIVESSPRLRRNLVKPITTEQILLRRPDGHLVEISVGAADAGGTPARGPTLLWCGLDEAAFFFADDGHTVNDRAIFDAAMGTLRTVAAAQIWITSTPWIEGSGLMEQLITDHWGQRSRVLVAARVSSYDLRGFSDDGSLREDTDTEESYSREVLARPLGRGAGSFFSRGKLAAALLRDPPAREPEELGAGGDFAFERDAAAVAVVARHIGGFFAPIVVEERHATPDDLDAATKTVRDLGAIVAGAGCTRICGDAWKRTFVREHLFVSGMAFVDAPGSDEGKAEMYGAFLRVVDEDRLCLAHLPPRLAAYIVEQLVAIVATPLPGPGKRFRLTSPRTKRTLEGHQAGRVGAHGDVADAIVKGAWLAGSGRVAKSWDVAKQVAARGASEARQGPAQRRPGAGGSDAWLRARSGSYAAGKGYLGAPSDD